MLVQLYTRHASRGGAWICYSQLFVFPDALFFLLSVLLAHIDANNGEPFATCYCKIHMPLNAAWRLYTLMMCSCRGIASRVDPHHCSSEYLGVVAWIASGSTWGSACFGYTDTHTCFSLYFRNSTWHVLPWQPCVHGDAKEKWLPNPYNVLTTHMRRDPHIHTPVWGVYSKLPGTCAVNPWHGWVNYRVYWCLKAYEGNSSWSMYPPTLAGALIRLWQRWGLPCRHTWCSWSMSSVQYQPPNHHDRTNRPR